MALADLLKNSGKKEKKIGYSPERIEAVLPVIRQYLGFFRDYPDLFVDFMQSDPADRYRALLNAVDGLA